MAQCTPPQSGASFSTNVSDVCVGAVGDCSHLCAFRPSQLNPRQVRFCTKLGFEWIQREAVYVVQLRLYDTTVTTKIVQDHCDADGLFFVQLYVHL